MLGSVRCTLGGCHADGRPMFELVLLAGVWAGVLWYIARTPTEKMQMTWLVLVALVFLSPIIAFVWPMFR
jgi:hypothetical protein